MLDQHKTTCYHCGENTGKPTVINQFPLCDVGLSVGWKNKSFATIAKKSRVKKAKIAYVDEVEAANVVEVEGEAKEDDVEDIEEGLNNDFVVDEEIMAMEEKEGDSSKDDLDEEKEDNIDENGVETESVSGSKKRSKRNKKTKSGYVCDADNEFIQMNGIGDFSSLPCNDLKNVAFLLREDNKFRNKENGRKK